MIVKLSDVVNRVNGNIDRFTTDLEYYVGGEHFESNELEIENYGNLKENVNILGFKFHFGFQPGDVLYMARNPHLRKASRVTVAGLCSDASYILRTKDENILCQQYLPIIMQSDHLWDYCESHKVGSVNFAINWKTLASYEFDLPPIEHQIEIAKKVWAAYRVKKAYKRLLTATDEMVKSQFLEMFGNPLSESNSSDVERLGDCVTLILGSTPNSKIESYWNAALPWITPAELSDHSFEVTDTERHVSNEGVASANLTEMPAGTVLFSTRAPIGKTAITTVPMYCNQGFKNMVCGERLNNVFLYYTLKLNKDYLQTLGTGTTFKELSKAVIEKLKIEIPPMELQNRFETIYRQADKSKFDGFKSQFLEMFGNPVTNPKCWPTEQIKDVAPESSAQIKPMGKTWLLNLDMIEPQTGEIIEKVYEEAEDTLSVQPFDSGNVLFSKLRPYLNKVVAPDENGMATTELVPLRPKVNKLNKIFLVNLLRSNQFVSFANEISGGTKMPRMPLSELRKFNCILPPMELQNRFEVIYRQADKSKFELRKAIDAIDEVIKSLING